MNPGETYGSIELWLDDKDIIIRAVLNDNRVYTTYTIHGPVLISHSTRNASATYSTDQGQHFLTALYFPE